MGRADTFGDGALGEVREIKPEDDCYSSLLLTALRPRRLRPDPR